MIPTNTAENSDTDHTVFHCRNNSKTERKVKNNSKLKANIVHKSSYNLLPNCVIAENCAHCAPVICSTSNITFPCVHAMTNSLPASHCKRRKNSLPTPDDTTNTSNPLGQLLSTSLIIALSRSVQYYYSPRKYTRGTQCVCAFATILGSRSADARARRNVVLVCCQQARSKCGATSMQMTSSNESGCNSFRVNDSGRPHPMS